MPIRLIVLLAGVLAGVLYLAFLNPDSVPVKLYPGFTVNLTPPVIAIASFIIGVVSVFLLYFYDTIGDVLARMRVNGKIKRIEKVNALNVAAREKLLLGVQKEASKLFSKALSINPDHLPSLLSLGTIAREKGAVSEAITTHSKARGIDPKSVEALLELGADYVAAEQYANAVSALTEARKIAHRSYPLLVRIRDIFVAVENWPEALAVQRQIINMADRDMGILERKMLASLLFETALEHHDRGEYSKAMDRYRETLRSDNKFIPAYLKLAEAQQLSGWEKDAIKTLEKGFKKTRSLIILKFLEALFISKGQADRVAAELRWARDVAPDEPIIRLFLASASFLAGDYQAARNEIAHINGGLKNSTLFHLLKGNTQRSENNIDQALKSLEEAYKSEMSSLFRFFCTTCHKRSREYASRCDECGSWNSFEPTLI